MSGYVSCWCRDCFEIAIADDDEHALCHACVDAGCDGEGECQSCNAYEEEDVS